MQIQRNKGIILISAFWIMAILSVFAIIIAHRVSFQMNMVRSRLSHEKAFYVAKAGIESALAQRKADGFKDVLFGEGKFNVGMYDEESRININKITINELKQLFKNTGFSDDAIASLAASTIAWRDKSLGFDAPEELLLVEGFTSDIFYGKDSNGLEGYVTVYGSGLININTASDFVLQGVLGQELSDYIIGQRKLGMRFVRNDLSLDEKTMLRALVQAKEVQKKIDVCSSFFRVKSTATVKGIESSIEAVAEFDDKGAYNFKYWAQK